MTIEEVETLFEESNVRLADLQEGHGYLMVVQEGAWSVAKTERVVHAVLDACHVHIVIVDSAEPVQLFEVHP